MEKIYHESKIKFGYTDMLLIITTIIWGLQSTIVKLGLREVPDIMFNISRTFVACITCWFFLLVYEKDWKIEKTDFIGIMIIGFLGYFINPIFYIYAMGLTTAGNAALIFSSLPIVVVLINIVFKFERITLPIMLGVTVSFLGIIFIISGSGDKFSLSGSSFIGDMMMVLTTISWAIYTIAIKKYLGKYSPLKITSYALLAGMISMLIFWFSRVDIGMLKEISPMATFSIVYSGALSVGIASVLWNIGVHKIGITKTSIYNNITPIVSVICGIIVLGEKFGLRQVLGSLLILIGLILTKMKIRNRKVKDEDIDKKLV
jgi:drug/metabolite transporter (DMT)-like permease